MSNQLEKVKELIQLREKARLGVAKRRLNRNTLKENTRHGERIAMLLDEAASKIRYVRGTSFTQLRKWKTSSWVTEW